MKTPILGLGRIGFTGIVFGSMIMGAGFVGAETYRQGGSTATIEQSGGSGPSESEVTRYPDGQKIITRDGDNTDITIQRSGDSLPPETDSEYPEFYEYPESYWDRFDRGFIEERFSRIDPDDWSGGDCYECDSSYAKDEFKRRALDRLRSDFLP